MEVGTSLVKEWKVLAEDYHMSPLIHWTAYLAASTKAVSRLLGQSEHEWRAVYDNGKAMWVGRPAFFQKNAALVLSKLEDKKFFEETRDGQVRTVNDVLDYSTSLKSQDFSKLSNVQLYASFETLFNLFVEMNAYGHVINLSDFDSNLLTNKLTVFLESKSKGTGISVAEAISILLTPNDKSFLQLQDEDFFTLLQQTEETPGLKELLQRPSQDLQSADPEFLNNLREHAVKYDWMQFHYDGPTLLNETYFIEELKSELKQGVSAKQKLGELKIKSIELSKKQAEISAKLGLSQQELYWIEVAKTFLFLKGLRKDAAFYGHRCAQPIFEEIAKRLDLSVKQVKCMSRSEMKLALENGIANSKDLESRSDFLVMRVVEGVEEIYSGEKARALFAEIDTNEHAEVVSELKGSPACPGLVRGVIKFIATTADMAKMNPGDILIAPATNPNLVPAMKKAGAIVTDEGGITCHAAIVSRELGIPCVVGTKIVTKAFKDGDFVEVDANKGIIRRVEE